MKTNIILRKLGLFPIPQRKNHDGRVKYGLDFKAAAPMFVTQ